LWVATVAALVSAVDYSRRFNASLSGAPAPAAKVAGWRAPSLESPTPTGLKTGSSQTRT
jgi:hypothetical protein